MVGYIDVFRFNFSELLCLGRVSRVFIFKGLYLRFWEFLEFWSVNESKVYNNWKWDFLFRVLFKLVVEK